MDPGASANVRPCLGCAAQACESRSGSVRGEVNGAVLGGVVGRATGSIDDHEDAYADLFFLGRGTGGGGCAGRSSREFGNGDIEELYARGPQGYLVVMSAGPEQALVCLAKSETTVGLLLRDVRKAAKEFAG